LNEERERSASAFTFSLLHRDDRKRRRKKREWLRTGGRPEWSMIERGEKKGEGKEEKFASFFFFDTCVQVEKKIARSRKSLPNSRNRRRRGGTITPAVAAFLFLSRLGIVLTREGKKGREGRPLFLNFNERGRRALGISAF